MVEARRPLRSLALCLLVAAAPAVAFEPTEASPSDRPVPVFDAPELAVEPTLVELSSLEAAPRAALAGFTRDFGSDWIVRWDRRSDRPHILQGSGVAIVPGSGNGLLPADLGLSEGAPVTLDIVADRLADFVAAYPELLGVANLDLRLDRTRSTAYGAGNTHWFLEFAQFEAGVPVEGANVFFRLSHGNLVQFGADRVAPVAIPTTPALEREAAWAAALRELQFPPAARLAAVLDPGSLHLYPAAGDDEAAGERYDGAAGAGYTHKLVWRFVFRLPGEATTFELLFDALRNQVLAVRDLNAYVTATVTGGVYPTTNSDPETVVTFPFANVTNTTTKTTDANGNYDYSGGTATLSLNGKYFQMSDGCGSISLSNTTDGNLALGTNAGTDCTTPGIGGAGNTHASRSGFYHLTRINRKAVTFFPANSWLASKVTANMNINQTCNAFWNGSTLNFYRSGGGCSNTGELAAVFLHEWGHGMDTNSGGAASESGSGEAVGDTFAFLETRDSCIGQNFRPGIQCTNCTACTGVRDVADFGLAGPAVLATPANVTHNSGLDCDRFLTTGGAVNCPYRQNGGIGAAYQGPMGYEGHCESVIASSANWDLAQMLVAQYGVEPGWAAMDKIWYGSLTPSKSAYRLVSGGTCNPAATIDGCAATNWYTAFLPADDDDGNLANGTPNACRIWDAFSAHGIACGTRPACSTTCATPATADAGSNASVCLGSGTTIGTAALPDHTYSWNPGGATTAQIFVEPTATTLYTLTATTACDQKTDTVTVTVLDPPATADAGADIAICLGSGTTIGTPSLPNHTYSWSPGGATTAQTFVQPVATTTYTVTASTSCNQGSDSVTVTVLDPPPTADAGADVTICEGQSTTIGTPAQPNHAYSWSPGGATTAELEVSPSVDTIYTVTATTSCSSLQDSVEVFVDHAPAAPSPTGPADGAVDVAPPIDLTWTGTPGASDYLVEIATDSGFANVVKSQNVAATHATFGGFAPIAYFWRVTPTGTCGAGSASATFSFTVDNLIFIDGFGSGDTTAWSATVP